MCAQKIGMQMSMRCVTESEYSQTTRAAARVSGSSPKRIDPRRRYSCRRNTNEPRRFLDPAPRAGTSTGEPVCKISRYLSASISQTAHAEQVWLVSVGDDGEPRSRACSFAKDSSDYTPVRRHLLLDILRTTSTRFVVVHYGIGRDAGREFSSHLMCKSLQRVKDALGFVLVDYLIADNIDGTVSFRSITRDEA